MPKILTTQFKQAQNAPIIPRVGLGETTTSKFVEWRINCVFYCYRMRNNVPISTKRLAQ